MLQTSFSLESPLGRKSAELEIVAKACDTGVAYSSYYLEIRGKLRTIYAPHAALDAVQRRINLLLFPLDFTLGEHVNGYVARRSTRTNAVPHSGAKHLQKFDVRDFFANIRTERVAALLNQVGFGLEASSLVSRLVSCRGSVPLGARTSPRISNLALWHFDQEIIAKAREQGITYTRYADDLSFSAQHDFDISVEVETALRREGFELNPDKSKKFKAGQPMFVTGLSVSDSFGPRLRKKFKRKLRQEFYYIAKFGTESHAEKIDSVQHSASSRLLGQYHYARSIEPAFAAKLSESYPSAYRALIPQNGDDRIARAQRHRQEFLADVRRAPSRTLNFYVPSTPLLE